MSWWTELVLWLFFTPQGMAAYVLFLACFPLGLAIASLFRRDL